GAGSARRRRRRLGLAALDTPDCQVAHDGVGDLEDARDLGQRRRRRREEKQVVDPLALVADLVRQLAAAPRLMAVPAAAVGLDALAHACDDLLGALLREVGVEQQQNLVLVHVPECSFPWTEDGPAPLAPLRVRRRDGRGEKRRQCSIAAWEGWSRSCSAASASAPTSAAGAGAARSSKPLPPTSCARSSRN